ncbi:MAG: hypothetical protein K2N74_03530 [Clostridiales bacterium]|nr:hypothetical protein [Clostridiales bacterium]
MTKRKQKAKRIGLSVLFLLFAVCLSLGIYQIAPKTVHADRGFVEVEEEGVEPATVYVLGANSGDIEGARYYASPAQGWSAAVARAQQLKAEKAENALVKVMLADNWTATPSAADVTSFGTGTGFEHGSLLVESVEIEFDLNGCILDRALGSTLNENGHIFVVRGGSLTLTDSEPENPHGNPLYSYLDGNETVWVTGGILTGAYGKNGGAIFVDGELSVTGATFFKNKAQNGGAVYATKPTYFTNALFVENSASESGGAVYATMSGYFTDATFVQNTAGENGGGIAASCLDRDWNTHIRLEGSTVNGNSAAVSGGGIFLRGTVDLFLSNSAVRENEAKAQGGGIYAYAASSEHIEISTIDSVEIDGNKALTGGGVYLHSNTLFHCRTGSDTKIINNKATQEGGGLFFTGSGSNIARVIVEGKPVVKNNVKGTDTASNLCFGNAACVLEWKRFAAFNIDGPQIGLSPAEGQTVLTEGYKANNSPFGCAKDPARYFFADDGKQILLNVNGEVTTGDTKPVWKVNGEEVADYGVYIYYGESVTSVTLGDGANLLYAPITDVVYENGEVSTHRVFAVLGDLSFAFDVCVIPKQITQYDVSFTQNFESIPYNGTAQEPEVTVTVGGKKLTENDYTVTYSNNKNAGWATAHIQGIGNYTGTVDRTFAITPVNGNYLGIVWEYFVDGEWTTTVPTLTYSGESMNGIIRAKLSVDGIADSAEYVYVQGVTPADKTDWNDEMWLTVSGTFEDEPVFELKNATTYAVTLEAQNGANASFPVGYLYTGAVIILPQRLEFSSETFAEEGAYRDEAGNKLWLVSFNGSAQGLIDGNGLEYVVDGQTQAGNPREADTYARYRGGELTLGLNGNYQIGGVKLQEYLRFAVYLDEKATGSEGSVTSVETTVTVTLSENYTLKTGIRDLVIRKSWKIVTINNMFTTVDGADVPMPQSWTYGSAVGIQPLKAEQGNSVIYTFTKNGSDAGAFAAVFNGQGKVSYFHLAPNGTADLSRPIAHENGDYFEHFAENLGAGDYVMVARVPRSTGVVPITREFTFTVSAFEMVTAEGALRSELKYTLSDNEVPYNGAENNVPEVVLSLNGRTLVRGVDYELTSTKKGVGTSDLIITGIGGLSGQIELKNAYTITRAENGWARVPSIMYWSYHNFDKEINRIVAVPMLLDDPNDMWFMVTTDEEGEHPVAGLEKFSLIDGLVDNDVAEKLSALSAGTLYLFARVEENENYGALAPAGIEFRVYQSKNYWEETPAIATWTTGKYDESENAVTAKARFGRVQIVITDEAGNELYNSQTGVNDLAKARVGTYLITATVEETDNYSGLLHTATFRVFEKAGLPWWVTLVVVLGVLLIAGIVLLILYKKGILQTLSGKMIASIRAKASADATIAAVKANKAAEEAKAALALAEARERIEALRLASEEAKNRPVREQAAALEERAQEAALKAERMQKKAARIQKQAATLKAQAAIGVNLDLDDEAIENAIKAKDDE